MEADLVLPDFDPEADPYKPEPYENERDEMLDDAEALREDVEAFHDYQTRPAGETVATLRMALDLAPDACVERDGVRMVRRSMTDFEIIQAKKRASLPPSVGAGGREGQMAKPSGRRSVDEVLR
jgi:hypothetical protein